MRPPSILSSLRSFYQLTHHWNIEELQHTGDIDIKFWRGAAQRPKFLKGKVDFIHLSDANQPVCSWASRMLAMYEKCDLHFLGEHMRSHTVASFSLVCSGNSLCGVCLCYGKFHKCWPTQHLSQPRSDASSGAVCGCIISLEFSQVSSHHSLYKIFSAISCKAGFKKMLQWQTQQAAQLFIIHLTSNMSCFKGHCRPHI